ncbi:MAG: C4-dicarboxylate TRAP transporter substrate-binding protein [Planctomycetota bacterium]|jgi:TRAP-type C4-dicarboxylate transport system substrate-binding protein|nr:C4-dicarboxylate TRAP transporter substrate-binding protein [Planctomycetota bacterium]
MDKLFGLALAAALFCAFSALGGDSYVMKLSTQLNETTPMVRGFNQLADNVKAKTNGRLQIQVYPSAQLGSDEDVIEQAMQGVNVAVLTDGGRMGNYVRDFGIIGMAYFADNYDDVLKVIESPTYKNWEEQLSGEGIRVLSFNWYDGPRHFLTHEPIKVPADLSGQRIRTPGAPAWAESIRAMGATPIAMPWGEVYSAVQSRAIDGCEVQDTSTMGSRTYEVLKYRNKTSHFQLINGLIVGERWFKTLPADLQKILLEETKAEGQRNARLVERELVEIEKKLAEYGMITTQPDVAAFKKAADGAYEKLNFTALRARIYKEIGK